MLDVDLAALYGVSVKRLNQQVQRNVERFPTDFMFQLTSADGDNLRSQIATSSWGGRRSSPYAFTEQGVAMLSSVLRSPPAVHVNIEIMRAFVRLRRMLDSNAELSRRIEALEQNYDGKFRIVFDAIRDVNEAPVPCPQLSGRDCAERAVSRSCCRGVQPAKRPTIQPAIAPKTRPVTMMGA